MIRRLKKVIKLIISNLQRKYQLNYRDRGELNFIDIGSIGGLPAPWNFAANKIKFLLSFDPSESPKRGSSFMTYNSALWEEEETRPFYIYKGFNGTGSSFFKQNFKHVQDNWDMLRKRGPRRLAETWFERSELIDTQELKCRRLDDVLSEEFPNTPFHFLKIDAQGAEYNILKGAVTFLSDSCIGLHLELFIVPLYEGIAMLDEVESFLNSYGFKLIKKFSPHGSFESQHDCLFLKEGKNSRLDSLIRSVYNINTHS